MKILKGEGEPGEKIGVRETGVGILEQKGNSIFLVEFGNRKGQRFGLLSDKLARIS